jgi:hypothetical protein
MHGARGIVRQRRGFFFVGGGLTARFAGDVGRDDVGGEVAGV